MNGTPLENELLAQTCDMVNDKNTFTEKQG